MKKLLYAIAITIFIFCVVTMLTYLCLYFIM